MSPSGYALPAVRHVNRLVTAGTLTSEDLPAGFEFEGTIALAASW